MSETLFAKLGGQEAITAVVDEFYKRILADDLIKHFFDNTDMEKQRRHQAQFISFALGGPNQYTGKSMEKAHEGMNIQPEHFNAVAGHLAGALAHFNVPAEDIDTVISHVASLRDSVIYK